MTLPIIRMDTATGEQWAVMFNEVAIFQQAMADRIKTMLRLLAKLEGGFGVNQLGVDRTFSM